MPNLETLSIEIDGNSQQASEGISNLIGSLRRLAKAVGTCVPAMREMNASLEVLSKFGTMRLPNFGNQAAQNIAKTTRAITNATAKFPSAEEIRRSNEAMEEIRKANAPAPVPEEARQAQTDWFRNKVNTRIAENEERRNQLATEGYKKIGQAAEESSNAIAKLNNGMRDTNNNARAFKNIGDEAEKAKPKLSGFGKLMEQIGRIAKTLLIRTALRNLLKSFSETWAAAYEYSKKMGGDFAESVEKARGAIASVSTSLIKTFAPVLTAIVPVIQAMASGINYLCTMIQKLFSLLGMTSDLFGASAKDIDKYAGSAGKGSKATKNLLAAFDELNVIQSQNNGSGAGGSGTKSFLSGMVSDEMATINMIVSESLMGIGLILLCTGHVGVGLGMLAVGAGMFAKAMTEDWQKMPNSVRKTIAEITIVSGIGMMAIGVMALCAGNIPLGIGLLAIGAAGIGVTMYAASGDDIGKEVKDTITDIMAVAGVSLMAIGLIAAVAGNIPLGLGLMVAGVASYAGAAAYNPERLIELAQGVLDKITGFFTSAWETIKGVWFTVAKWMDDNVFTPIATFATNTWNAISKWWDENISTNISTAWESIKTFFTTLFGDSNTDGSIAHAASTAWETISKWWTENISTKISEKWDAVTEFFKDLFGGTEVPGSIASYANDAWCEICKWWEENIVGNITAAWEGVTGFFSGLIGDSESGLIGSFSALWAEISQLWGDIVVWVEGAWGTVATWFNDNVTKPVGNFFIDCINGIIDAINWIVRQLNSINVTIPGVNGLWDETRIGFNIKEIARLSRIGEYEEGGYGIPKGDLFIANEAGAEMVGSMNGKTTVANNEQIVEGIRKGVRDANSEQNALLKKQNELLLGLLNKDWSVSPSADWGKFNQRSNELWGMATGR